MRLKIKNKRITLFLNTYQSGISYLFDIDDAFAYLLTQHKHSVKLFNPQVVTNSVIIAINKKKKKNEIQ